MTVIRKVTKKSLRNVLQINKECFLTKTTPTTFRVELEMNGPFFLASFRKGTKEQITGYILGITSATSNTGWIRQIAVSNDMRRLGVAESLMAELEIRFIEAGCLTLKATVSPENDASLELFKKCGFSIERTEDDYYLDGEKRHILFKKLK